MSRTLTPKTDTSMMARLLGKLSSVDTAIRNRDKADQALKEALGALHWDLIACKEMIHRWMSGGEG